MNVNPSTTSLIEREKEMNKLRNYKISLPSLDDFTPENSMTSGYKSEATSGMSPTSVLAGNLNLGTSPTSVLAGNLNSSPRSLVRRQDDQRFKTQTIMSNTYTKSSDLDSDSSSSTGPTAQNQNNGQRKTIRQKRAEEAERFRTQTIEPLTIIEKEAANVVDIITESKTSARSRSASAEGKDDSDYIFFKDTDFFIYLFNPIIYFLVYLSIFFVYTSLPWTVCPIVSVKTALVVDTVSRRY